MSELSALNLADDFERVLAAEDAAHWKIEKAGPLEIWATLAPAARLGDQADDRHCFIEKRVLVTGECAVLATVNGRDCFLASVRLLLRMCRHVTIAVPADLSDLKEECRRLAANVNPSAVVAQDATGPLDGFHAVLNVGGTVRPDLPWTAISSSGWIAQVSSGATGIDADCSRPNAIGSLAAACLGVGEVFKRLVALKESRGKLIDGLSWSVYSYSPFTGDFGPEISSGILAEFVLVGFGAIGNGVLHLLSKLPLQGLVLVVDPQEFGRENLGTCLLVETNDIGMPKVVLAERLFQGPVRVQGYMQEVAAFARRLRKEIPYPKIVLGALGFQRHRGAS